VVAPGTPTQIEERYCPDLELENVQTNSAIQKALLLLSDDQKKIINLAFGFEGDKPMSVNKICKQLNISRLSCIKNMNGALALMRECIKI
jgi:DNA-directed RNA polymerase sigma subunit (sigma70/sigma32)